MEILQPPTLNRSQMRVLPNHRLEKRNNLLIRTLVVLNHRQKLPELYLSRLVLVHRINQRLDLLPCLQQPHRQHQFLQLIDTNRPAFLLIQRAKILFHLLPLLIIKINQVFLPLLRQPTTLVELLQKHTIVPHLLSVLPLHLTTRVIIDYSVQLLMTGNQLSNTRISNPIKQRRLSNNGFSTIASLRVSRPQPERSWRFEKTWKSVLHRRLLSINTTVLKNNQLIIPSTIAASQPENNHTRQQNKQIIIDPL